MNPTRLPRLLRTLRHLKASQIFWRARYMLERRLAPPRIAGPSTAILTASESRMADRVPLFHHPGQVGLPLVEELERGRLTLLHQTLEFDPRDPDWRLGNVSSARLWTITLHYHGWIYALARVVGHGGEDGVRAYALLERLLRDWLDVADLSQPGARDLAWNSFAISTRLGHWFRVLALLDADAPPGWPDLAQRLRASAWRQASYLSGHIEWDLRGNHLLRDLVGLAWAGAYFGGEAAEGWLRQAGEHTPSQLAEQVMPDGAHFECSPMYHVHAMEDVLVLALLLEDADAVAEAKAAWLRMAHCLRWLRHPDGGLPLLNDGGLHAVCHPSIMLGMASHLGFAVEDELPIGGRHFPDLGLVVWHGAEWDLFFDVGPLAARHVPGHGHADHLTIECSYRGQRLFVDPGCHGYDRYARRDYDRSTAAHNTVTVDDANSSELWHIFRAGRRAEIHGLRVDIDRDGLQAEAEHDGYRRIQGQPTPRRWVKIVEGQGLTISDRIGGGGRHRVSGGLLVDPMWSVVEEADGWRLECEGRRLRVEVRGEPCRPRLGVVRAAYHPDYGVEIESRRLIWSFEERLPATVICQVSAP